jgi:hypothetical protein
VDEFLHAGPWFAGPKTLSALRRLGTLEGERVVPPDLGDRPGSKPEIRRLEFDGLTLVGEVDGDAFKLRAITVTSPHWELPHGLKVGSPASQISTALNQPLQPKQEPMEVVSGEAGQVSFSVHQGRISKVEITLLF